MDFTKDQLNFLENYLLVADKRSSLGSILHIRINGDKARFTQFSHAMKLSTPINCTLDENWGACPETDTDFSHMFLVDKLVPLFKTSRSKISITKEGIRIDEGVYHLETFQFPFPDIQEYVQAASSFERKIQIKDLKVAFKTRNFIGTDELAVVGLMNNHFVSSDRILAVMLKAEGLDSENSDSIFYFSDLLLKLLDKCGLEEFTFSFSDEENKYWTFTLDSTFIVVPVQQWKLPNLFDPSFSVLYANPDKLEIHSKNDFVDILNRMLIVTNSSDSNRVYFTFDGTKLFVESRSENKAKEELKVSVISGFKDVDLASNPISFVVSASNLLRLISLLSGEKVFLSLTCSTKPGKSSRTITVTDENDPGILLHTTFSLN